MFESAELGHKLDKATYEQELPKLREALLTAQFALRDKGDFPVLLLFSGVNAGGRGETVNALLGWLDPRSVKTRAFRAATADERALPRLMRYFKDLPRKGQIGISFGAWYTDPIMDGIHGRIDEAQLGHRLRDIAAFERMLFNDGALILKFWLHLRKKDQRRRLKQLENNPLTRFRVTEDDWNMHERYGDLLRRVEHAMRVTSTVEAPWFVVEGKDRRYRELSIGKIVAEQIDRRLKHKGPSQTLAPPASPLFPQLDGLNLLSQVDLDQALPKKQYSTELKRLQAELSLLSREPKFRKGRSVIALFEGPDAAGKGGAIRRISRALDARLYDVVPIAAPNDEERAHHYLWRFARHLPLRGRFTVFDRSWYGRVLVERVEGFCSEDAWKRAYSEINAFEAQLIESQVILVKFWLAISQDKQLERFRDRERTPFKRHKITPEDYRNRSKWDAYQTAASEMFDRTSTRAAPWTLVAANDKYFARVEVLRTLVRVIEQAL